MERESFSLSSLEPRPKNSKELCVPLHLKLDLSSLFKASITQQQHSNGGLLSSTTCPNHWVILGGPYRSFYRLQRVAGPPGSMNGSASGDAQGENLMVDGGQGMGRSRGECIKSNLKK